MENEIDQFKATVSICKGSDRIATASGTLKEVLQLLPDVDGGYYLLEYYKDYSYMNVVTEEHFRCRCRKRGGLYLTESTYCNWLTNHYLNETKKGICDHSFFGVAFWGLQVSRRIEYDRQKEGFQKWSDSFFTNSRWKPVQDLNEQTGKSGIYALVLDNYNQCYIGQAQDNKCRIMQHWSLDRACTSGINMFRAKDTTRIYVIESSRLNSLEYQMVSQVPRKYSLNILSGGSVDYIMGTRKPLAFGDFKTRKPWFIEYRDFQIIESQYYEKYLVKE